MALKSIDPTTTESWKKLQQHFEVIKNNSIKSYFIENDNRKEHFSICLDDLELDYSKNKIDQKTVDLLVDLANEVDLKDGIEKLFTGDKINTTEKRAVLHTALRNTSNDNILVDGQDIMKKVSTSLDKMKTFSEKVISGNHKGYTGKAITDVVNIGIGGSDLGPRMVVDALQFYKNHLNTHFISNIDGDHLAETLKNLNPETTLFIIVSKTFTTQETLTNALSV
ncbi:MAG: glucose-6-phosphate isomerase, partial [Flavobacteriaceae bacterium]|nr:glucose-6-phosphate isomerase [Flavobacteriaceae bacterium]